MQPKVRILVVDDDKASRNLMATNLEIRGYSYALAESGQEALLLMTGYAPDLVLIELDLPDINGIEIIHRLRTWSTLPLIVVSDRTSDKDKVMALDEGANDYVTKPFSIEELFARIRVALRRNPFEAKMSVDAEQIFTNGQLHIDFASRCVKVDDIEIHLTPIEYKLVTLLAKNIGKVLTHPYILKEVWQNYLPNDTPSLRVFMATLRKKIDSASHPTKMIQTHVGVGYRMIRLEEDISNLT